jgi:photosystem II stability/assembly factor-like uncharacterized protein
MKSGFGLLRFARLPCLVLALAVMAGPEYSFGQSFPCGLKEEQGRWIFPNQDLYSVHFFDANRGWVVGANKLICLTFDGGLSWRPPALLPSLPSTLAFHDVQFVSVSNGWVVGDGGTILRTFNGGNKWAISPSGTTNNLRAVYFVGENFGWAVGDANTIRKTNISGPWTAQSPGTFDGVSDIYCINTTMCRAAGSSSGSSTPIKWSNNGGSTWWAATVSNPASLNGIHFASPLSGFAVGYSGAIRSTTDGGLNWSTENSGTTANLYSVHCVSTSCWAVGSGGTILKGPGWGAQNSGTTATLYHVHFINANTGWAVGGNGTLLKTINGGATWKLL